MGLKSMMLSILLMYSCNSIAHPELTNIQVRNLHLALKIGKKLGIGDQLAAVAFQESSLGLDTHSQGHFGVGSVGYSAWKEVMQSHPWLSTYFKGRNWSTVLLREPAISLWVSGYYLKYCRKMAGNWWRAMDMYRYGSPQDTGRYPTLIQSRLDQVSYIEKSAPLAEVSPDKGRVGRKVLKYIILSLF